MSENKKKCQQNWLLTNWEKEKSDSQIPDLKVNGSGSFITIRIPRSDFD